MNISVFSAISATLVTRVIWLFALVDSKESFVVSSLYSWDCSYAPMDHRLWAMLGGRALKQGMLSASST